jgi:hypothetical protein
MEKIISHGVHFTIEDVADRPGWYYVAINGNELLPRRYFPSPATAKQRIEQFIATQLTKLPE